MESIRRPKPLALVTGASSGIGAAFARELGKRGCDLVLVARRGDRLERLAEEVTQLYSVQAESMVADLTRDRELHYVADRVRGEERLEFLVNNAGFGTKGAFFEAALEGQEDMHRLHVLATMVLCHAALQGMVRRNRGAIINVSSIAAFLPSAANSSYNSTKAWVNAFTESLWLELRSLNSDVRVQAVCPGLTTTEFHERLGMDRNKLYPNSGFWLTCETVVQESLEALSKAGWRVVPSGRYKVLAFCLRHLPDPLRHRLALVYSRKARV